MNQTVCDRCNRVGGYAGVSWKREYRSDFPLLGYYKDLCKECFNALFPEWKEKEDKEL